MQRQSNLDDQDENVVDDRQQQLAQPLRVLVPISGRGVVRPDGAELVESQKTVEQGRRRIAETGPHGFGVDEIALDEQTGEARGDAVGIEVELRKHLRRFNPFTGLALGDRGTDELTHLRPRLRRGRARRTPATRNPGRGAGLH